MNDVTKITSGPAQVKPLPASSQVGGVKGQKTGNDLPVAAQAARSLPKEPVNSQAIQEQVQAAVKQMNEYIQSTQRDLNFTYDPASGDMVVKVLDRATQEVIRQIPDAIFLRISQSIAPEQPGKLFNVSV
jgi:flagellar protein FlaG